MRLLYLEYKNKQKSMRETNIHAIEIARAIKIIQKNMKETDESMNQTSRKPTPTPKYPQNHSTRKERDHNKKGKKKGIDF